MIATSLFSIIGMKVAQVVGVYLPFSPSPSKVAFHNETTNEWCQKGTSEDSHGENSDSQPTSPVIEHV
jgi:ribosomal protein S16